QNPPRSHALRGSARTQPQTRFLWLAMHSHAERGNEVPGGFCDSLEGGDPRQRWIPAFVRMTEVV
ncbi:hypothetical protein, partial [Endozoicomonas sp.]|uniref:hypothetical protein n=1 Tax=Endozoicomonas sp. TaxID=1892382 RepID=UPI00383A59D9